MVSPLVSKSNTLNIKRLPNLRLDSFRNFWTTSAFQLLSEASFSINRKLLRRRHVRKEQVQKRKEREAARKAKKTAMQKRTLSDSTQQPRQLFPKSCSNSEQSFPNTAVTSMECISPPRIILHKYPIPMSNHLPAFSPVRRTQRFIRRMQETC